jgi:hypothetical protein
MQSVSDAEKILTSGRHSVGDVISIPKVNLDRSRSLSDTSRSIGRKELLTKKPDSAHVFRGGTDPKLYRDPGKTYVSDLPEVAAGYAAPGEHLRAYRKKDFTPGTLSPAGPHLGDSPLNSPIFERTLKRGSDLPEAVSEYKRLPSGSLMKVKGPNVLEKRGAGLPQHPEELLSGGFPELLPQHPREDTQVHLPSEEKRYHLQMMDQRAKDRAGPPKMLLELLALAGPKALQGAQMARLADRIVNAQNQQLEKSGGFVEGWRASSRALKRRYGDSGTVLRMRNPIKAYRALSEQFPSASKTEILGHMSRVVAPSAAKGIAATGAVVAAHEMGKRSKKAPPAGMQKKAYKLQGQTEVQGIPVAIENRKGSVRKGKDADGKPWRTKMIHPYGYIKGTKGADGEEVDAYVGPKKDAPAAFVVHQRDKETGKYDEDKVMLGFPSKAAAKKAFLAHYDSPKFLGPISRVSIERLKVLMASKKQLTKIGAVAGRALQDELDKLAAGMALKEDTYKRKMQQRFSKLKEDLDQHGDEIGTGHKRILIPKRVMNESDLTNELGFVPVKIGIPEAGQARFESFRHPGNLYHLHDHDDAWSMHKDEHPASTMLVKKWQMAKEKVRQAGGEVSADVRQAAKGSFLKPVADTIRGLPHVITEGIPGAAYYVSGKLRGAASTKERLQEALPGAYTRKVNRWKELKKAAGAQPQLVHIGAVAGAAMLGELDNIAEAPERP